MLASNFNPWKVSEIYDYSKLIDEFGISPIDDLLPKIKNPNKYMKRKIIFGHRNFEVIIKSIRNNLPFSVVDGFMPTGPSHLGHKLVMDQIIWYQKNGGSVFISIADLEAYAVRHIPLNKCYEIGIQEYILNLIALGLKPENTNIYFQSKYRNLQKLTFELGMNVNFTELSSIYGFSENVKLSHMTSVINQVSDILLPQLKEYNGPKNVIVPVGSDQDPHIRLTRDLANKSNLFTVEKRYNLNNTSYWSIRNKKAPNNIFLLLQDILKKMNLKLKISKMHIDILSDIDIVSLQSVINKIVINNGYNHFYEPSSTYHKFMSGLNGGKMSSSIPESHISLTEPIQNLNTKIKKAKTGGKQSIQEQKENGGDPSNCPIYELFLYHLSEDNEISEIYNDCINGKLLCGTCKKYAHEYLKYFIIEHKEKRELAIDNLDLFNFLC